jgi:hypothetical protein
MSCHAKFRSRRSKRVAPRLESTAAKQDFCPPGRAKWLRNQVSQAFIAPPRELLQLRQSTVSGRVFPPWETGTTCSAVSGLSAEPGARSPRTRAAQQWLPHVDAGISAVATLRGSPQPSPPTSGLLRFSLAAESRCTAAICGAFS